MRSVPETLLTLLLHRKGERRECKDGARTKPALSAEDLKRARNRNICADNQTTRKNGAQTTC